jgi:predicted permease
MSVVGRLRPSVVPARASAELRGLVAPLTPEHPSQFRPVRHSPVDVVPLLDLMTRDVRTQLLVLLGAVGCILLIACTNVANLLLARAHGRQREVAVQMALGCSPRRVVRQVLVESLVLGVGGGAIGVLAAVLALPLVRDAVADYLPRTTEIGVDAPVLLFALGVSVVTGLVFGALPALHAAGAAPGEVMRATAGRGQSQGRRGGRANDLFVVAEIALSLVLLAGAGLLLKSLWRLTMVDPGFSAERVLSLQLTLPPGRYDSLDARAALLRRIEERLGALPGVETVGAIDFLPLSGVGNGIPYRVAGQEVPQGGAAQVVNLRTVTPDYFRALRVPLLRGRMLGPEDVPVDSAGEGAVVVNEAFARLHWPDGDALGGRILTVGGDPVGRVVGVVRDVRQASLDAAGAPELYVAASQWGWPGGALLVRGSARLPSASAVTDAVRALEPDMGVRDVRPMADVVRAALDDARFYARLLGGFAAVALLLGLVGVYGVMSYAASRRTREFGVRLAFGATERELLLAVLRRAMAPVAVGVVVGVAGALALGRLLSSLLYDVATADPWVLGGVALLLVVAAGLAALVPAARAARLSPVSALQAE